MLRRGQVDISLVKSWLDECKSRHNVSCSRNIIEPDKTFQTYLIDVVDMKLIAATLDKPYLILSYVWGGVAQFQLTRTNRNGLLREGSLREEENISRQVKDAMLLTSSLAERYLWVDALCIIQDDEAEKPNQIRNMAAIYGKAKLLIAPLDSQDANSPIPGVRPDSRSTAAFEVLPGIYLAKGDQGDFFGVYRQSIYKTCMWTFQEHLLSKRCLFFTQSKAFFICRSGERREDSPSINNFYNDRVAYSSALTPSIRNIDYWSLGGSYHESVALDHYAGMVCEYTQKHISYPQDILDAFSGIGRILEVISKSPFYCGLPGALFHFALMWTHNHGTDRKQFTPSRRLDCAAEHNDLVVKARYTFCCTRAITGSS
jgi:Heterokaryon incompatibility protein (HET)